MKGKNAFWSRVTPELIVTLVIAIGGWLWAVYQHLDERPAIVIGYVEGTAPELHVQIDNRSQPQLVDDNNGFFRFDGLVPGTHNLRFEHVSFGSYSQPIFVDGTGEHVLEAKIILPKSTNSGVRNGQILQAVSLEHSEDGTDPLTKYLVDKRTGLILASGSGNSEYGWVYLGEVKANPTLAKWLLEVGSTTQLVQPAVMRSAPPTEDPRADGYVLGLPVRTLEPGQQVELRDVYEIEGKRGLATAYWARVKAVDSPH